MSQNEGDIDGNKDVEIHFENAGKGDGDGVGDEEHGYEEKRSERGESHAHSNVGTISGNELDALAEAPTAGINSLRDTLEGNSGNDDASDYDKNGHETDINHDNDKKVSTGSRV